MLPTRVPQVFLVNRPILGSLRPLVRIYLYFRVRRRTGAIRGLQPRISLLQIRKAGRRGPN